MDERVMQKEKAAVSGEGFGIDESTDQPGGGRSIDTNILARHPFHETLTASGPEKVREGHRYYSDFLNCGTLPIPLIPSFQPTFEGNRALHFIKILAVFQRLIIDYFNYHLTSIFLPFR